MEKHFNKLSIDEQRKFIINKIINDKYFSKIVNNIKDNYCEYILEGDTLVKYNLPIFTYIDNRRHILKYYPEYDNFVSKYPYSEISGAWDEMYFLSLLKYVNQSYKFMEYKSTFTKWLQKPIQRHPITYGKLLESDVEECKHSFFIRKRKR